MFMPEELALCALDIADLDAPGGALEMRDGAKKRIYTPGDRVQVYRVEEAECRARKCIRRPRMVLIQMARSCMGAGTL